MRFLTPTQNKRLNELIGFLCLTLAVLIALALISYSPRDASFNVSARASGDGPVRNWIGPAGAYGSDLFFQMLDTRGILNLGRQLACLVVIISLVQPHPPLKSAISS